ncbi:hypothetical protein [Arthrobacter sp. UNC362MFTsu5.1]|uniref:hypothetical protein n=1 Tax=Arthrobacter sp. UNC362MFTsu5.1 TaxID=1449044 RepID=UPI00069041AA|nr:hypothetical protein [Arthrobacter sp. UNC362MFTsu5.1]
MTATESLFRHFFDDAATFPPGLAPLRQAIADAAGRRGTVTAGTVGPSVIKLEDVTEAHRLAQGQGITTANPLPLAIVVPAGALDAALTAASAAAPILRLEALELKVSEPHSGTWRDEIHRAAAQANVPVYIELSPAHLGQGGIEILAETGLRLKYRTGGLVPDAFPTPEQLARVLAATVHSRVPFKLTAGLHRAARYTDAATGFTHHGFLNIAQAVDAAMVGANETTLAAILRSTDEQAIAAWGRHSNGAWRTLFGSFGTCSVSEPLESLAELGLVPSDWAPARQPQTIQEVHP